MLFSWEKLAGIFTFSYFRYLGWWFAITPIAISIISAFKENNYLNIQSISLPFSWEILWFSSFFYVLGYVVFLFSCPNFIKKYKNLQNYEKLMFPKDHILEEWIYFIKKFRTLEQFSSNVGIRPLLKRKMVLVPEGTRIGTGSLLQIIDEKCLKQTPILESYYEAAGIYLDSDEYRYIFCTFEVAKYREFSEETAFKKYYVYLSEVYEKINIKIKIIISILLWVSFFFFLIILAQNIYHALIYIYSDFREHFLIKRW
ncbi:hypothetical protein [Acetobacter senegalensis]|uniref:hypothetical protein n=1 Tax=Acetobacter senegalensis TaxID=446692 RepID=UPI002653D9F0|nr:hypothetical protein [Acetobacter senegalensis]MDN7355192.1 hypothetical protein [Acetobacter senegalensis]